MSWNKPSEGCRAASRPLKKRTILRGVIAGALVIGAGVVVLLLSRSDSPSAEAASKKSTLIREVKPHIATNTQVVAERVKDPHEGFHLSTMGVWQPNGRPSRPGRKKVHGIFTNQVGQANDSIAANGVEQIMLQIFSREPGDMPMPLPSFIPKADMDNLIGILLDKHPVTDKDTESVKMQKETLLAVKQEMMKFVKDGGDPHDFLKHYHDILCQSFNVRMETQKYVMEQIKGGETPEVIDALVKRSNEELKAKGIKPIRISPKLYKKEE